MVSTFGFIFMIVLAYLVGLISGYFPTKIWYARIIDAMTTKNQQLIERVKKAESVVLYDLLQLSPDDISLLKSKTGDINKPTVKG